ncbi:MAG: hypothetical protein PSV13_01195 [Lacunisphaera sp.]|nr:hypothetical protein [Lacunisphaera sp.]
MLRPAPLCLACALTLFGAVLDAAPTEVATGEVVELPPFVVTGFVIGPPWRYAEIPGYEILSQCSDDETREIVAALWRGPQLVLPPALRPHFSLPMTVVLFNQPPLTQAGNPQTFGSVQRPAEMGRHWTNLIKRSLDDRESYALNLWPGSFNQTSAFRFDICTLLRRRAPATPLWLKEGLFGGFGLYREGVYWRPGEEERIVPVATWCSLEETRQARNLVDIARKRLSPGGRELAPSSLAPFIPALPDLIERTPPAADDPSLDRWAAGTALFVRWGIYGRRPEEVGQFWRFVERTCAEPATEALFQECFGRSYASVHAELSWYLAVAVREEATAPPDGMLPLPRFNLRAATVAEIARLRGEWERMEAAALAPRFPDLAKQYREQAARTFARGYKTKEGREDPRLQASLGLLALETEQFTVAAQFLEAAVARQVPGPLPYLEAARLRWAIGRLDDSAVLSPEARPGVIALLLQAELQGPPLASVYLLLARAVAQAGPPTPDQAAALERGRRFFPRRVDVQQLIQTALAPPAGR